MIVSWLELLNKGLRRSCLGQLSERWKWSSESKCGWSKENLEGVFGKVDECWKQSDSIDASKVEGALRRIEVELVVPVVSRLVVILLSVWNVRAGFIVVVLMCLGRSVILSTIIRSGLLSESTIIFVCRTCLGHNCSVEEKLEFKKGEEVLEEVEKFCYLGDLISCHGGASR